jgi:tetratricopeptide (TPR) repeat protein/Mrp family chromosome partitioning ATPase
MPDLPAPGPTVVPGPTAPGDGRVVTFYSFKGGTGRTMALANVAWILAANGLRVLVVDWDLESPGLHRFFHPFLKESQVRDASGIIDLIRSYERGASSAGLTDTDRLITEAARVQQHALSLDWAFPGGGSLDFLSSGRQNLDYAAALSSLDWDNFYESLNGGKFLDAVRADMKSHYDYALIDSRTGLSDTASICTAQLPDVLVDCFTLSTQGIEGAAEVAKFIEDRHRDRGIRILPVPMRVEPYEMEKVEAGRLVAIRLFAGLPRAMSPEQRRAYWATIEVPYQPFYAYEETLAVFGDAPGRPGTLLTAFERLAAQITDGAVTRLPLLDEHVRNRTKLQFARKPAMVTGQVTVEFRSGDEVWSEWIADVLRGVGVTVRERRLLESGAHEARDPGPTQTLTVVSSRYVDWHRSQPHPLASPHLPVYVTSSRPAPEFAEATATFLAGVSEQEATRRLLRLVGITSRSASEPVRSIEIRYPGDAPRIDEAPTPNKLFTGREDDLRKLREQLRDYGTAFRPVILQGLGGVGKTQVALEYVNRFKTDYDLVFWIDCGLPEFIDASLADLAARMPAHFDVDIPATGSPAELARIVLRTLSTGRAVSRWLLIFDNAEDIPAVRPYLPTGGGHVLITSRSRDWEDLAHAEPLSIDLFKTDESIEHLRQRVPSIDPQEAREIARALGNLPLGVAAAGAWLAETGQAVSDYLVQLQGRAPKALAYSHLADYPQPVSQAWDPSLDLLRQRSPAAARLFELCSVMAPGIALDLLHSTAMASVLEPFDPAMAEPELIGKAIREIDKLALIKLDRNSAQVQVHLLVQAVVQDRMSEEQLDLARADVHQVLAASRPSRGVDNPDTWDRYRTLWPHLTRSRAVDSAREPVRQLLTDRVRYLWLRGDLERGQREALRFAEAWQAVLDADPLAPGAEALRRQLLHLRFNLANILRDQAKFKEAEALDEQVLSEQQELLGPAHPHTLMTAGGLAGDLRALGHYSDALRMDEDTYPRWTELFGESHPRTLAAANNLAESYRLTGNVRRSLRLDEDTLDRRRAILGPQHPRTLDSASGVVRGLLDAGRYTEAATRMDAVWQTCVTEFGADSRDALNTEVLFAIALRSAGQPERAETRFEEASAGLARRLGADSTEGLAGRLSHALNLLALGQTARAQGQIQAVHQVYENRLGSAHPHTLVCQLDTACALRTGRRNDVARVTILAAADGLKRELGPDHPYTLAAMAVLAVLLADQGDLDQAEATEAEAVAGLTGRLGRDHPDTLRTRASLLLTRMELGVPGAQAERDQVIDELVPILGADHPHIRMLRGKNRLLHALDPQPF